MDLGTAVLTLSSEMGIKLEARETISLGDNVTGAKLYSGSKLYGAIALITDVFWDLQSCAYLGEYPGQTGVDLPPVGKRDQVSLDLDTRQVPFSSEDTSRLVRVDHNTAPFLGKEYDGWDAFERNHLIGTAAGYAKKMLEHK